MCAVSHFQGRGNRAHGARYDLRTCAFAEGEQRSK